MTTSRAPFSTLSTLLLATVCVACTAKSTGQGTTGSSGGAGTASGSAGSAGSAGETDGSAECMTRFDAESCAELGDLCEFDPKPEIIYWDGGPECTTIEKPGYGWCFPRVNGGSQTPQAYWNPTTREITALSFMSFNIPPGWEVCEPASGTPPCCCGLGYGVIELPYCGAGASTGGTGGSGGSTSTGTGG